MSDEPTDDGFGDKDPDDSFDAGDEDTDEGPMTEDQQGYPGGEAT